MPLKEIDRTIIDHCLRHEAGSWVDFVDRYIGLVYHVIDHVAHLRSVELTPEEKEEICEHVFHRLMNDDYKALRSFKAHSSLPTYLTVVTRRIVVKEIVKRR